MKYEDYEKLTPKQKEEYNFKFKDFPRPQLGSYFLLYLLYKLVFTVSIISLYLAFNDPKFEHLKEPLSNIVLNHMTITLGFGFIFVISMIVDTASILIYGYKFDKWKKENKICQKRMHYLIRKLRNSLMPVKQIGKNLQ